MSSEKESDVAWQINNRSLVICFIWTFYKDRYPYDTYIIQKIVVSYRLVLQSVRNASDVQIVKKSFIYNCNFCNELADNSFLKINES